MYARPREFAPPLSCPRRKIKTYVSSRARFFARRISTTASCLTTSIPSSRTQRGFCFLPSCPGISCRSALFSVLFPLYIFASHPRSIPKIPISALRYPRTIFSTGGVLLQCPCPMRDPLRDWRLSVPEIFRQQERIFCVLNLVVIVSLLCANYFLARFWGPITPFLFCTLLFGFFAYLFLLFWIQYRAGRPDSPSINPTTVSILLNTILTLAASTTNRDDSQYYVLMCVPVLQAA